MKRQIMVGDSKYDLLTPLAPKFPNFAIQILLTKNNFLDQNWRGSGPKEASKIVDNPYIFAVLLYL